MVATVAYDITRLFFIGPSSLTPRGIDRVDLLLANYFFSGERSRALGIIPTPWGIRAFEAARVRRGLQTLERLWSETTAAGDDLLWQELRSRILGRTALQYRRPEPAPAGEKIRRFAAAFRAIGVSLGKPVLAEIPDGSVYLNIGQVGLAVPRFFNWLQRRPDIAAVFMLHDVIPLDTPELVKPSSVRTHANMVLSTARHADGLIVTTEYAGATIRKALASLGRHEISTFTRRLPVPQSLLGGTGPHAELSNERYFVICGSIELRKNPALLHKVWKRLALRCGASTPHLVLVGSPGWKGDELLDQLEACTLTRRFVHPVSGLSSAALAQLMQGAAALLMPSWSEGFGLPVLEANALGVPTIASDIPSHREIANAQTLLLAPHDVEAWERAILATERGGRPVPQREAAPGDEADYCRDVADFLARSARDKLLGHRPAGLRDMPQAAGRIRPAA